ncbi:MAG TPA: NAD-dependent epimerase/dehydratase family protein [Thermoanaerobaculia bacterium]|nr:NAD-dependent epimerase/dehydratase family protein [Thermoanaerobaculia bacterium]
MLKGYRQVLVTGGLGFIGRHLTDALRALGKDVIVLDNLSRVVNATLRPDITFVDVDIRDSRQTAQVMEGVDLVFHTASNANGTISVTHPRFDFETNVVGTFNVAEAATKAGVKRLVYLSSASVYGRPQRFPMDEEHPRRPFVPYGASKLAGELACLSFHHSAGLPVVVGRPFCVYGPGENPKWALVEVSRFLRWPLNNLPIPIVGDIDGKTRDFVHVRDLVSGLLLIADKAPAGEVFNVGSGTEVSMRQLVQVISVVTGREAVIAGIPEVTEDTYRLVADIGKIRSLGYVPQWSLVDGVREIAALLGDHPEVPSGETIFKSGQHGESAANAGNAVHVAPEEAEGVLEFIGQAVRRTGMR